MTVSGELKIVAACDIGELGQADGEAVTFNWKWYYSVPGLLLWLVLILAMALPRANHDRRALLILIPLVVLNLLWLPFKKMVGMPSASVQQSDTLFLSMAIGIAVLWLIANNLSKFGGFIRFLLSLITVIIVAYLGILSYSTNSSREIIIFLVLFVFMTLAMLAAISLAGRLCRRRYRPVHFMLWLGLWMLLINTFAMFGYFIIVSFTISGGLTRLSTIMVFQIILLGIIIGLCLYVLNLPFMILGFVSPFFRERFKSCLCPASPQEAPPVINQPQI